MSELCYEELRAKIAQLEKEAGLPADPAPQSKREPSYEELKARLERLQGKERRRADGEPEPQEQPQEQEKVIIPLCHHVRESACRCGSAAMQNRRYCYYHQIFRGRRLKMARARRRRERWQVQLPPLEDLYAVQVGIQQVLDALGSEQLDRHTARVMLTGLRQAAANLRLPQEEWDDSARFDDVQSVEWSGFEKAHGLPDGFDVDTPPEEAFPPANAAPDELEAAGDDPAADDHLGLKDLLQRDPERCERRAQQLAHKYRRRISRDEDKLDHVLQVMAAARRCTEARKPEAGAATAEAAADSTVAAAGSHAEAKKPPQGAPERQEGAGEKAG